MLTVVLLMLLGLGILSLPISSDDVSSPVGNRIKLKRLKLDQQKMNEENWGKEESSGQRFFHGSLGLSSIITFWSKEECAYLINLAKPHMVKSTVVDGKTGKSKDSRVRDKVIANIEQRIADYTFVPADHGEDLQVLHYEEGQKYEPHYDYIPDVFNTKNGGQRIATLLMYLSDVEEGGETVFPTAKGNFSSIPGWNEMSECARGGLSVKPKMGDAFLFWIMRPDASLDPSSLHGGCPVIKGNSGHPQSGCMSGNTKSR
ncbi:putative prolyl 4-hydroxylase 3 [Orobanche hederae]